MGWLHALFGRVVGGSSPPEPPARDQTEPAGHWRQRGNAAIGRGDFAEAARCYEQALAVDGRDAALCLNSGFALLELGQLGPAEERLLQALALRRPQDPFAHEAHYLLARARAAAGRLEEALASAQAARVARPDFAEAVEEGARVLVMMERHAQAVEWLQQLVRLRPTAFNRLLLANSLSHENRHEEALACVEQATSEDPMNAQAHLLRYSVLLKLRRPEEALQAIDRTLELVQPNAQLIVNRSVPLERLGRYEESLQWVERALAMEPENHEALANRATVLMAMMRVDEAIAAAEDGLRHHPASGDLHWNLGVGLLATGQFQRGWRELEWRTHMVGFRGTYIGLTQPAWRGEDLTGKTILLHGEQGFGDSIQFVRFVPEVARLAAHVRVLVPEPLHALLGRALPENCRILRQDAPLPAIDYQCAFMSLPAIFGTTLETLPGRVPYLRATAAATQRWRERLGDGGPRIGISWSGNPIQANDRNRSMTLATFRAIETEGCRFLTIQPQVREADREALANWTAVEDVGRQLGDFDDTAGLMEALDLVITTDTSVAHLAGALGKPVWILLCHSADWRWLLDRDDSPWYPTARLYRQRSPGSWDEVLERVRADLANFVRGRRPPTPDAPPSH